VDIPDLQQHSFLSLETYVPLSNTASIAIVRRLGMTYEGRIRDHVYTNGRWRDSLLYSVLVNEWVTLGTTEVPDLG
jgi:RimJ/RimL family protein N-acetyltransferase